MAISRGAGTEIIRSASFEDIANTAQPLIIGVQHHIYTVLSILINLVSGNAATDSVRVYLTGWDAYGGASGEEINMFFWDNVFEGRDGDKTTFVWADKFSFNGCEPTGVSGAMNTAAEQDAIADQGTTTSQTLYIAGSNASTTFDVHVSYIDQNNA